MFNHLSILGFSFSGLSLLTPTHFPPWMSWHSEAVACLAVLMLGWKALLFPVRCDAVGVGRLYLPFLVIPLWTLFGISALQWGAGQIPWGGQVVLVFFYTLLCTICLAVGFAEYVVPKVESVQKKSADLLGGLACSMLVVALCSVFIALCQAFSLWESSAWIVRMPGLRRPGGNMAQPNHLATLLIMGMASAAYLQTRTRWSVTVTAFILLVLGVGLAATESRTGLLSLLALLAWWWWKQPTVAPHASRLGAGSLALVVVAMFAAWPTLFNAVHMMGDSAIETRLGSISDSRFQIWPQLGEAVLQKPWWGWGVNQTAQAHNAIAHRYGPSAPFTFSHNLVLDVALWVGLPLTALLIGVAAVWGWRRARATRNIVPWYGLAIALPVVVHSMLEYPFAYTYFLIPVMLGLGVAEGALAGGVWMRFKLKTAMLILLIATGLMAWSAIEYLKAEEDYRVARFEVLRLGQTPSTYERPKMVLLTQLGALLDSIRLPLKINMNKSELDLLRDVALHYPLATIEYRYAMALALNGNFQEAMRQLQVMRMQHGMNNYINFCRQMESGLGQAKIEWRPNCSD